MLKAQVTGFVLHTGQTWNEFPAPCLSLVQHQIIVGISGVHQHMEASSSPAPFLSLLFKLNNFPKSKTRYIQQELPLLQ